jgi:hypothetical protein
MDVVHAFALFIHVQLINCLSLGASYVVHLKMYHIIHACIMCGSIMVCSCICIGLQEKDIANSLQDQMSSYFDGP